MAKVEYLVAVKTKDHVEFFEFDEVEKRNEFLKDMQDAWGDKVEYATGENIKEDDDVGNKLIE